LAEPVPISRPSSIASLIYAPSSYFSRTFSQIIASVHSSSEPSRSVELSRIIAMFAQVMTLEETTEQLDAGIRHAVVR